MFVGVKQLLSPLFSCGSRASVTLKTGSKISLGMPQMWHLLFAFCSGLFEIVRTGLTDNPKRSSA